MTTELQMPTSTDRSAPPEIDINKPWMFDHVPGLNELLTKQAGRPGLEYMQCTVVQKRRAQDEGWLPVENTAVYTIVGPKGAVDMELLARGKITPGQPHNSGARLCFCDKSVELLTGLWVNPNQHTTPPKEEKKDAEKPKS